MDTNINPGRLAQHTRTAPGASGVAGTSPMLGHSRGTLRLYKLPREVQKLSGGLGASSPRKVRNFTASQVGSEVIP